MSPTSNTTNENIATYNGSSVMHWYTPLTRVTPLSKYLALALFVVLPFVGFWLGVGYGALISSLNNVPQTEMISMPLSETTQEASSTIEAISTTEPRHESGWEEYRVGSTSLSFRYPPEVWSDVQTKHQSINVLELERDNEEGAFSGIDLQSVQTESDSVSFSQKFADGLSRNDGHLIIYFFTDEKNLFLSCYEGSCGVVNLIEEKADIDKTFSFENNGLRWKCTDGYFRPAAVVTRNCTAYQGNMRVVFKQSYGVDDIENFRANYLGLDNFTLDAVAAGMADPVDFMEFIQRYNKVLNSITFGAIAQ